MKFGLKLIYFLNIVAAIFSLMAFISPFVQPKITGIFSYFSLGFPILLFCHIIFLTFWLIAKPKYCFLSLLILIMGYKPLLRTVGLNSSVKKASGLNIMSYNIGYTRFYLRGKKAKETKKKFKSLLKKEGPDVICLQERANWQMEIYNELFEGYKLYAPDKTGTAVYSKLPVVNNGNIGFDTKAHNATWIDVVYKKDTVRVYSVHLSSNKVKNLTDNIKEIWDESLFILDKYNEHGIIRVEQMNQIINHAEESPHPVVITGDLNDVPQSYVYKMISEFYCDAFIEQGVGLGKTYITRMPGLRIDYAFSSEELEVADHKILKVKLSDHYPIVTKVKVIK